MLDLKNKGWIIEKKNKKPKLKKGVLIVGLPGIGNVGKISADFLVDELKAKEIYKISSSYFPHSVFITDDSELELPSVNLHYIKSGKKSNRDLLILSGDIQPMNEKESYLFCEKIVNLAKEMGCTEIITMGGIGLSSAKDSPKVYGVLTNKKLKKNWKKINKSLNFKNNEAATIVGATGLIPALGKIENMKGISLLCETVGHPYHLGLNEAIHVLKIIKPAFKLKINLNKIKKEMEKEEVSKSEKAKEAQKHSLIKKLKRFSKDQGDVSYIG